MTRAIGFHDTLTKLGRTIRVATSEVGLPFVPATPLSLTCAHGACNRRLVGGVAMPTNQSFGVVCSLQNIWRVALKFADATRYYYGYSKQKEAFAWLGERYLNEIKACEPTPSLSLSSTQT